jgi:hypothetical protein
VSLDSRPSCEMEDQRHDEQEEKDIKDDLRYSSGCDSDAAKPQDSRNDRNDEKRQNPAQHAFLPHYAKIFRKQII